MWSMLAAVGPVLGEGEVGFMVTREHRFAWTYAAGVALNSGRAMSKVERPYRLVRPLPPVAVLIGPKTASAGEAIAVAFQGRPSTRFVGQPTAGLPTANQPFPLPDGAKLFLMVAVDADRRGRTYDGPILPDTEVAVEAPGGGHANDSAIDVAAAWLRLQPECHNDLARE
jgi:carboxyl-terminal processing protease